MKCANMDIGGCRAIGVVRGRERSWIPEYVYPRGRGSLGDRWSIYSDMFFLHGKDIEIIKKMVERERAVGLVGFRWGIIRCLFII
jgi:hypothetical protein